MAKPYVPFRRAPKGFSAPILGAPHKACRDTRKLFLFEFRLVSYFSAHLPSCGELHILGHRSVVKPLHREANGQAAEVISKRLFQKQKIKENYRAQVPDAHRGGDRLDQHPDVGHSDDDRLNQPITGQVAAQQLNAISGLGDL